MILAWDLMEESCHAGIKMSSITDIRDLRTIHSELASLQELRKKGVSGLKDIFSENARLIISPSNQCYNNCLHCVADSNPKGEIMKFSDFEKIDSKFFELFKFADFGRRGNPIIYSSEGRDLADMISFIYGRGIKNFSIAAAIMKEDLPIADKLGKIASQNEINIETMITYHHYFQNLDRAGLAKDFNTSIKSFMRFSSSLLISLLGDGYLNGGEAMAEDVARTFAENREIIFQDITISSEEKRIMNYGSRTAELQIPPADARVYPLGRFREYLSQKKILNQYEKMFEKSLSDYVCPDLIRWPGIIIEPDGDLNLCASFEAIASKEAIVSNIFRKPFNEVEHDLMRFHEKEIKWFAENIDEIIECRTSTCKMKNCCYSK